MANRLERIQPGRLLRRIPRGQRGDQDAHRNRHTGSCGSLNAGQVVDEVDLRIERDELLLADQYRDDQTEPDA